MEGLPWHGTAEEESKLDIQEINLGCFVPRDPNKQLARRWMNGGKNTLESYLNKKILISRPCEKTTCFSFWVYKGVVLLSCQNNCNYKVVKDWSFRLNNNLCLTPVCDCVEVFLLTLFPLMAQMYTV